MENHNSTDILEDIRAAARTLFGSGIQITKCSVGNVNTSCFLEGPGIRYLIKAESRDNLPRFYSRQILRDREAARVLSDKGVPCAKPVAWGTTPCGRPYLVSERLQGVMLSQAWGTLTPKEQDSLKKETLLFLEKINSCTASWFGSLLPEDPDLGNFVDWNSCFLHLIHIAVEDCLRYGTLTLQEAALVKEAAALCAQRFTYSGKPAFCHMDLHWYNLMVHQGRISGFIDFGSALYAPVYSDLFRLDEVFLHGNGIFFDTVDLLRRKPSLNPHESFSAELLYSLEYFDFLSMSGRAMEKKNALIDLCQTYIKRI